MAFSFYYSWRSAFIHLLLATQISSQGTDPQPLKVLKTTTTPNGFRSPARGWNSFGLQANPAAIAPNTFAFDQAHILTQADALSSLLRRNTTLGSRAEGDYYISLDSGWSLGDAGDAHGRIQYNESLFRIPELAESLHKKGLKLGVYVIPGSFVNDGNKTILGTEGMGQGGRSLLIRDTWSDNNNGFGRMDFDFDKPGVQEWHDSVVEEFASWGVDLIKLDYITPGSPHNGVSLQANNSGSVVAYHRAIENSGRSIRLDISWKLERNETYMDIWESSADSMRTDQDINNGEENTLVAWATVQRAIDNYRDFAALAVNRDAEPSLSIYPDMDNLYVGNDESITGVSDTKRTTIATHWIGAAANLITGSDLTQLDDLGKTLMTHPRALQAASFTAQYPMQPRNPGTGGSDAQQLQAWIAGPSEADDNRAIVVLANYGPDEGQSGFDSKLKGSQTVSASWQDLGISGKYNVDEIWGAENSQVAEDSLSAELDEGESRMYLLTPTS